MLAKITMWTAVLLFVTAIALPTTKAQDQTFHANGAFASGSSCWSDGIVWKCLYVSANRGQSGGQPTTFLYFDLTSYEVNTGVYIDTSGAGQIPNSAFQVKEKGDTLSIDTSAVPNYVNQICSYDPNTQQYACVPSSGGLVAATFAAVPTISSYSTSGTSAYTSGGITYRNTGKWESSYASTNVSMLGTLLSNVGGSIGTNHSTVITVQRH